MGSYLLKRIAMMALTVWGALTIMFVLLVVMPGDAVEAKQGEKAISAGIQENIRRKYGLDESVQVQYVKYWKNLAQGELGYSVANDQSVNTMLGETGKTSLRLAFWGGMVQLLGSLGLGFLSAAKRNSVFDKVSTVLSVAAQSIPVFVTGLLLQVLFGVIPSNSGGRWNEWFNLVGFWPSEWRFGIFPKENWKVVVLPAVAVGIVQMAFLARLLRSSLLEVMRADYLRTARAKGLSPNRVLIKHALRNALIPWITAASLAVVETFGIAVQTELTFGLFGVGSQIAESAQIQDTNPILGLTTVVVLATAIVLLLVDLFYSVLDPRIRVGSKLAD
jgi:oligopeptide transport system permease protein